MTYDPAKHHRRSIRWKGFDYSSRGIYYVTICAHQRQALFGEVKEGSVELSLIGELARAVWYGLVQRFAFLEFDEFVVMPNHLHGLLACVGPLLPRQIRSTVTLGSVIGTFKSISTIRINKLRQTPGKLIWQRNYYEHVVRNSREMKTIQTYIRDNPRRWEYDPENPQAINPQREMPWEMARS